MPDIQNTAVRKIRILASVQPRDSIDHEVAAAWAELLMEDPDFQMPAGVAFQNPRNHDIILADGFTRHSAYSIAERHLMPLDVREGDEGDAVWYAIFANGKHGRPLSHHERHAAIIKALGHRNRGDLSHDDIAKLFGVSRKTIVRASADAKAGQSSRVKGTNVPGSEPTLSKEKKKLSAEALEAVEKIRVCNPHAADAILNGSIRKPEDELIAYSEMDCDKQVRLAPYFLTHNMTLRGAINAAQKRPTDPEQKMGEYIDYALLHGVDQEFFFHDDTVHVFIQLLAQTPVVQKAPIEKAPALVDDTELI